MHHGGMPYDDPAETARRKADEEMRVLMKRSEAARRERIEVEQWLDERGPLGVGQSPYVTPYPLIDANRFGVSVWHVAPKGPPGPGVAESLDAWCLREWGRPGFFRVWTRHNDHCWRFRTQAMLDRFVARWDGTLCSAIPDDLRPAARRS